MSYVELIIRNKKPLIALAVIALLCALYFLFLHTNAEQPMDMKVVEVVTAKKGDISESVRLIGEVRPKHETTLVAKETGVLDILVHPGERASANTVIAKIINAEAERQYNLNEQSAKIAEIQHDRANTLLKSGTISKTGAEDKKSSLLDAQNSLATAKIKLDNFRFYAPFDGVVGVYKFKEGAQVKAGDAIVSFYDPSVIMIEFDIPGSFIADVTSDTKIVFAGKEYQLTHAQRLIDPDTHMSPAFTEIQCDNCILGATENVELILNHKQGVVILPNEAVFIANGKESVYVIKDGKTHLKAVETGIKDKSNIEITSGIEEGEVVVAKGQSRLTPDMAVKIYEEPKSGTKEE